jgi:hypothetical protein
MAARKRVVEAPRKRRAPELLAIRLSVLPDEGPDTSYLDDPEFADRREAYGRGEFTFVGVRADAGVRIGGVIQTLTSGGLWGIESDSGEIDETIDQEWRELRKILIEVGVSTEQLPDEVDPQWVEWRV